MRTTRYANSEPAWRSASRRQWLPCVPAVTAGRCEYAVFGWASVARHEDHAGGVRRASRSGGVEPVQVHLLVDQRLLSDRASWACRLASRQRVGDVGEARCCLRKLAARSRALNRRLLRRDPASSSGFCGTGGAGRKRPATVSPLQREAAAPDRPSACVVALTGTRQVEVRYVEVESPKRVL